jgi:nucleoside-diphosphate-sugar epimerase
MKNSSKKTATRLGKPRLLVIGCGDVGMRCLPSLRTRFRIFALTSDNARCEALREAGAVPVVGNLDDPASLARLRGLATRVVHLAPPPSAPGAGPRDPRTRYLRSLLASPSQPHILPERFRTDRRHTLVYASTSGVYGDCGGAWIDETHPLCPANPRAYRRVSAERQLRAATARGALSARIVRIPGIYAENRLPLARLERGTPALDPADDVYTNHIHADDLATILLRAAARGKPSRAVHASDDSELKMGEYFDRVAHAFGLPPPPRVSRADAERLLEPTLLSFMRESRRLRNARLKRELRVTLRYPSVDDFLRSLARTGASGQRR